MKQALLLLLASYIAGAMSSIACAAEPSGGASPTSEDQSDSTTIQEVVVTATRRSENLQSVPIAVTAVSAQEIANSGLAQTQDLALVVPNLTIVNQAGGIAPYIRGIGSSDANASEESPVAVYVDGVYQSNTVVTNVPFTDVDHVEVLAGPQGTLFGRNAAGGLINIITRDPTQTNTLEASLSGGNYATVDTNAYANLALTDKVATNLAISYFDRGEGFGKNITTNDPTYLDWHFTARNKWLLTPSPDTEIKITADYYHFYTEMGLSRQLFPGVYSIDHVTTYTGNFYDATGNNNNFMKGHSAGLAAQIRQTTPYFQVVSISAYRYSRTFQVDDLDYGPQELAEFYQNYAGYGTFTQELQLLSKPNSPIKWVVGAFYYNDQSGYYGPYGAEVAGPEFGPVNLGLKYHVNTQSEAAYGEGTIPLVASTRLTLGARYTTDKRTLAGDTAIFDQTTNAPITRIPLMSQSTRFDSPTWRVILDHDLTQDMLIYASYNRGFKSGNYNVVAPGNPPFKPETVDTYEGGIKTTILDHRLVVNGAVFYNKYKELQLESYSSATGIGVFTNAPDARTYGAELNATAILPANVSVRSGISYLNAKFTSFPGGTCYSTNPPSVGGDTNYGCNLTGATLPNSPEFTFNIEPTFKIATQNYGHFALTATYYYTSRFYYEESDFPQLSQQYSLLNGRLEWTPNDRMFSVALWAKNMLNKEYYNYMNGTTYGNSFSAAPPRTFGMEISFKL